MSVKQRRAMLFLVLAFVLMATAGAVTFGVLRNPWAEPAAPYEDAGESLPVLEALAREQVTFLRVQDWCRAYADGSERRANTLEGTCTLEDGYKVFDVASEQRFTGLRNKLDDLPYDVRSIEIKYGSDGGIETAHLALDTINPFLRDSLAYDPGYVLSPGVPGEFTTYRI